MGTLRDLSGHLCPDGVATRRSAQQGLAWPDRPGRDHPRPRPRRARALTCRLDRLHLRQPGHDPGRRGDAARARLPRGPGPQGALLAERQGAAWRGRRRPRGRHRCRRGERRPVTEPRVTHGPEHKAHNARPLVEGTGRLEAFSDGVFAIVVTLLIIEVHLPPLVGSGSQAMLDALGEIAPKLVSFTVSFATVAIYWVNHHHFFSRVTHTDWKLLWANNLLLFWLTVVPFTTAVVGDHPTEPVAVFIYGINLALAAASFSLMGWYVFFKGDLVSPTVSLAERRREWRKATM